MKKTSFTKLHTAVIRQVAWVAFVCFTLCSLSLEAQIPACTGGSVTPVSAGSPVVDAACSHATPDVSGAATVVAPAGYVEFARVQAPNAGDPPTNPGLGPHDIFVDVLFHAIGDPMDMCVVQATETYTATDNIAPTNNCMGAFLVDVGAAGPCTITIDEAYLRANMFNTDPTDNCTALADLTITASVTSVGPMVCGGPNPQNFPFVITVDDNNGNTTDCNAVIQLRDVEPPNVTWNPGVGTNGAGDPYIELVMDPASCAGTMPDLSYLAGTPTDNCGEPVVISQSTPIGDPVGGIVIDPVTGCPYATQLAETVRVTDCFGNISEEVYEIRFLDQEAPQFNAGGANVCTEAAASVNFPATPLVADGTCMITIPDLTDMIMATDNCPLSAITITQNPVAGTMVDVSGMCPPDNFIDVTFTPMDCDGNMGTPVTCTDLLEFTDNTPPTVVCPADPITVVIPFDGTTCEIGMAMVDLPLLIAEGVTVTDACDTDPPGPGPQLVSVTPNMFTCSDMGKSGLSVDIVAEDCFGNQNTPTSCAVEVVPDTDHTAAWSIAGADFIVCPGAPDFPIQIELGANTPSCGVWSGDVAVSGTGPFEILESAFPDNDADGFADPGSYSLTYTVGPIGCHISETHNIMVAPEFDNDDAALIDDFSICLEATEVFALDGLLAAGSIPGGAWSIVGAPTGSLIGQLAPNAVQYLGGDGTITLQYTLADCDADIESDQITITIDEKPDGHFAMADDMCQDEGTETPNITGVPGGATVSFASLPAGFIVDATTGEFDPAAGPLAAEYVDVTVTMTVSNGVCTPNHTVSQVVRVYESGDPAFDLQATVCETDPIVDLILTNPNNDGGANPVTDDNVTWTGTSVGDTGATGTFDPSVGPGIYTVCVTVGAPSCEETVCHDITVEKDYTADEVALIADFDLCLEPDDVIDFNGLLEAGALPGGNFAVVEGALGAPSGNASLSGTINGNSYEYNGGCGTLTITHSFLDDCQPNDDVVVISIVQKADVGGLVLPGPLCVTDGEVFIDYSGTPELCDVTGVFSGTGVTDLGTGTTATFDPATAGESADFTQHEITYTLASPNGICEDVVVVGIIQVDAASPTDFTTPSEVCANEVVDLALDNPNASVLPASPDGNTEVEWFGGDGLNAVVTDNNDGTGTFVGYVSGTYNICVRTGDVNCSQTECQQITVDITPPVLDCADLVRTRDNDTDACSYDAQLDEFDVTATDNCVPPNGTSSLVLTHDYAPYVGTNANSLAGATFPVGITQVIWTATDTAGNSANCTIEIVINDTEDPTNTFCPTPIAQGTDADICGANVTYTIPQFEDNCDGVDLEGVLVSGYAPGTDFPVGVTTVTWEYTDLADNATATCTFTVTITDDDNPTPICSPAYAVSLDGDGEFDVLATDIDNGSYDNCQVVSALISRTGAAPFAGSVTMTCADVTSSPITVTLQVTDQQGLTSTCTTEVTVNDDQDPDIECPGDYTVVADPTACSAVVTYPAPTVTDNCTFNVAQIDMSGLTSGDAFPIGTTTQTYEATDIAGNTESCSFTILVIDEVAPTVDCGPSVRTESADPGMCSFTMPGAGFDAVGADNCPGVTITHNYPYAVDPNTLAGTAFPVGSTTVTWIATDAYGNQSDICGIEIVVTDDEDPTIDCGAGAPANILMNASFEAGGPFNSQGADNWVQFGPVFRLFASVSPAFFTNDGDVMVKTFGGAAGLFQDFPVSVGDQLNGSAYFRNASFDAIVSDNHFAVAKFEFLDGGGNIINFVEGPKFFKADLPIDVWTEATVSAIAPPGTVNARFVVVSVNPDPVPGAIMMDDASVTIGSGGMSGNITVSNDAGECGADLNINNPMADDNCGIVSIINDYNYTQSASGFYPVGTTVVGFTATDAAGNTAECTITVTVTDDEDPTFVNCPTTMVMIGNDPDQCSGKLNWSIPVAEDNCDILSVDQTGGPVNGDILPVGVPQTVTYTATDVNGNTETCEFDVQVVDTQEPSFDADIVMPGDITVECDAVPTNCVFHGAGNVCEPLDNDDVNDNCTASADLTIDFDEQSTQDPDPNVCAHYNYTLTRTWTVTDEAGNALVHVQVITVQDTQAPTPVCQDATVTLDKFGAGSINPVDLIAGTTDNCAPFSALNASASQDAFSCDDLGPNTVTLTVYDPCMNIATCDITVTVEEGPAPCEPEIASTTSCLNNATTLINGQFAETITITSLAMETWTLTAATGLYTGNSANPPAAPTPVAIGTQLTAGTGANMILYTLDARFVEGIGYSATFTNNDGDQVTISNLAYYPTPVFTNLFDPFCLSTPAFVPEVVDQFAGAGAYDNIEFFINGDPVTELNPADLGFGQHEITVVVDAGSFATGPGSETDPGCIQSYSEFFQVVETPTQVVCNDLIQVTLEEDCDSEVTPDMVLEGTYPCFDDYEVHITLPNGVPLNPSNIVTGAHAGLTLDYSLVHPTSGNVCWGSILVEDKTAPEPICPDDVQILCTVDPDSIVYWLPFNHPCYPATDYFGNQVPINGQLLYLGEPDAIDCSDWTWEYTDDYTTYDCAANPALVATIVRTFVITDEFGNQSTCEQVIEKLRGEVDQISWPADLDFACNDPILGSIANDFAPSVLDDLYDFECGGNTQGWPEIWETNLTTAGTGVCGLGITYSDQIVNLCAESYKVVRTWTVHDWCPANGGAPTVTTHTQYIKVTNVAPVITIDCQYTDPATGYCVLNATEPGTPPHVACSAIYIPFANVDAVCDEIVEITVETPAGFTTNGGYIPAPGLPLGGPYDLVYRAEDQCGNITEFVLTVLVQDKTAPIAVCDEITDVNLSADGLAVVAAETFDDGSYDGCCLEDLLVRRMVDNCGIPSDLQFGPNVTFCCEDIGPDPIMVVFRAVDCFGNYNDCMVEVNVSDKIAPILVTCPSAERVTCDWYADNLQTQLVNAADVEEQDDILSQYFGSPEFFDNCELDLDKTVNDGTDQCLEGIITRSWTASDPSGNESQTCTQFIFVDHVSDWVVEFPDDIEVNCGTTPPDFGEPEIFFETCELVAVSYEDELFTTVPDACYKILRTWTVINWCVVGDEIDEEFAEDPENQLALPFPQCDLDGDGDCDNRTFRDSWAAGTYPGAADATTTLGPDTDFDSDPWDGYITYQQTIKVIDDVDPVFVDGCEIDDVCIEDNTCAATVTLPTPDIDECSSNVTFQVSGDLGTGFGPFFNVAPGTYEVTYVATDNCNNQTACETTVTVVDCKKPTPYCKNGLIVELMNTNPAMVEVWAADLDAGSFDNCPGDLVFSFSANTNDTGITYGCDDLGQNVVQIWVTDATGNQDYCETFVEIQANMGQCDDPINTNAVAGLINTEELEGVSDVDVQLSGSNQMSVMTDADGTFSFNVATGGDYTVTPVKDDEPLNGVTTFDLVLITKHILGVQPLSSPYKMIAADANKSNSITTFDLVQLRKLILFIDLEFQNNTSWRFVETDYEFPNPNDPWEEIFPEVTSYNNIDADQLSTDFVAVKIGDVNGSAATNLDSGSSDDRNSVGSLIFNVDDTKLKSGETYTVDFMAQDFDVQGYQFTLNFDRNALEFVEVASALAGAENFGLTLLDKGAITTSWNENDIVLANGEVVFSLVFKATADVKLSDVLSVNSRYTKAEAYQQDGELLDIELTFNGTSVAGFDLYQNTPNPFSTITTVGFNLPEASSATLTITDVSGKVVKVVNGDFAKGYNEIRLQRGDLPGTGIMYYQLDTDTDSATKMMLLVD